MPDYVYQVTLDDSKILDALNRIDANIDKMANNAGQNFNKIQKHSSDSGMAIGAMAGAVDAVAEEFIKLGEKAVEVFADIVRESIKAGVEEEMLRKRISGMFDGNQEAATEAFEFIEKKSRETGLDLKSLAENFLPKTKDMAQFEQVAKIASALALSKPEAGVSGASTAITQAMGGTFTQLQRTFKIAKSDIKDLQDALKTGGTDLFLSKLEQVLKATGRDFETLTNTAQGSFNQVNESLGQLEEELGGPIVEQLKILADKFLEFYAANRADLVILATEIGKSIGDVISILDKLDLSKLDVKALIEVANDVYNTVEAVKLFIDELNNASPALKQFAGVLYPVIPLFKAILQAFSPVLNLLSGLEPVLTAGAEGVAYMSAVSAGFEAELKTLVPVLNSLVAAAKDLATGNLVGAADNLKNAATAAANTTDATKAFNDSMAASNKRLDEHKKAISDNVKEQDDLRTSINNEGKASTSAADAMLAQKSAERDLGDETDKQAEAQAKLAEKVQKTNEEISTAARELATKLEDIDIATERKRMDVVEEFANKRLDAAKKNLEDISDVKRKNKEDIQDAEIELSRAEQDIARKFADVAIADEEEKRKKLVDVEQAYLDQIKSIRQDFDIAAEDAERKRDAIAFLEAVRRRDRAIANAQDERQTSITGVEQEAVQKRAETQNQQKKELDEARLANKRKLEDLQISLERELDERKLAYQRELETIRTEEQRKLQEVQTARQRDIEDARRANAQKLADLQSSLAAEQAAASGAAGGKSGAGVAGLPGGSTLRDALNQTGAYSQHGQVTLPQAGTVGSVNKSTAGKWLDMMKGTLALTMPNMASSSNVSNVNNSRSTSVNLPMATEGQLVSSVVMRQIKNNVAASLAESI